MPGEDQAQEAPDWAEDFLGFLQQDQNSSHWFLLTSLWQTLERRQSLVREKLQNLSDGIAELQAAVQAAYEEGNSDDWAHDPDLQSRATDVQYTFLDSLQHICPLIECLAILTVNTDFSTMEGLKEIHGNTGWGTTKPQLENLDHQDLQAMYKVPGPSSDAFDPLTREEKEVIHAYLVHAFDNIKDAYNRIVQFRDSWNPVYNKYKHAPVEQPASIWFQEGEVLRYNVVFRVVAKEDGELATYLVSVNPDVVPEMEEILERCLDLLFLLLTIRVLYFVNEGEAEFVPPFPENLIDEEEVPEVRPILEKIDYRRVHPANVIRFHLQGDIGTDVYEEVAEDWENNRPARREESILSGDHEVEIDAETP